MVLTVPNVLAQAEPWPYDTAFYYTHHINSPVPDSFLTYISVRTVNAKGLFAQSELIPWDTATQTFRPINTRYTKVYDAQDRVSVEKTYWDDEGVLKLAISDSFSYNNQGTKIYSERLFDSQVPTLLTTRTISHYRNDGLILKDTVWSDYGPNSNPRWGISRNRTYRYQGDLLVHKEDFDWGQFGRGSHLFKEEIYSYDSTNKILESRINRWSDDLMQIRPDSRTIYSYHTSDEHQLGVYYWWNENDSAWNVSVKDSTYNISQVEKIKVSSVWDDGGFYKYFSRITEYNTDTLQITNTEKFAHDSVWIPQSRTRKYLDSDAKVLWTDQLRSFGPQGLDTLEYKLNNYSYFPNNHLRLYTIAEYFFRLRAVKRHYTQRETLLDFASSLDVNRQILQVLVYPNPNKGILHIELENEAVSTIEILSLDGRLIQKKLFQSQSIEMRLENLPPSIYLIHIQQGEKTAIEKLVLEP